MTAAMRTVPGVFGIALLSFLAIMAVRHGWADLGAFQGRAFMKSWDKRPEAPGAADWALAQSRLEHALALDPGEPGIAEDLGRLHEMRTRAGLPAVAGMDTAAELGRALDYFNLSLARRPTSPYTWANIALVKARLGAVDAALLRAVGNAAMLGPWEPEVQVALAEVGFRHWNRLPKATQEVIHAAIGRGLKRQDGKLFELALAHGRMDVMCSTPGIVRSKRAIRCI
jgi:hypothetical protein